MLAMIGAPEGGGSGLGFAEPPLVTGPAGGGADEVAVPCVT